MKLHAIRAFEGDCLLLEKDDGPSRFVLVDGGPASTFDDHLKAYLSKVLPGGRLEAVIVSHVDRDHIVGVLDLMAELKRQKADEEPPLVSVGQLWHNTFSETIDDGNDTLAKGIRIVLANAGVASMVMAETSSAFFGIAEGEALRRDARLLEIGINSSFGGGLICPDLLNPATVDLAGMQVTVVGPTHANLNALRKEWEAWIVKNRKVRPEQLANADRSVPNLSSLVLIVKDQHGSLLLTGDARGDHIEQGLDQAGLRPSGTLHVDVMKLQHHGSSRNATREFFRMNTADVYVVSANGRYGNPDHATLAWIVEEARDAGRTIQIVATNQAPSLEQLKNSHPADEFGYELRLPGEKEHAVVIEVGRRG